jgi:hypothetical protein
VDVKVSVMNEGMGREGEAQRALRRVLVAAETMARELRRREIEGDRVAGGLCEEFERARDAFSAHAPQPVTSDLRHVAEALERGWHRGSGNAGVTGGQGSVRSLLQRVRERIGAALPATGGDA